MSDLSAADIAEGQLLYQSMIDVPSNESYARLLDWAAPRWAALLDAAEKVERVRAVLAAAETETPDDWGVTYVYTSRLREAIEGTRNDSGE